MTEQSLEAFVETVGGGSRLRIEHDFGDGFVRLRTSEAERRQAAQDIRNTESIVLELLRNSRDAHATRIFLAMSREGDKRTLTVVDNGVGIPPAMHEHVFEPRVTSKLDTNHMDAWGMHGRGMALFSIRENVEYAHVEDSGTDLGCSIRVRSSVGKLPERSDQSSFPTFELADSGSVNVRGPRNILRTACEFALDSKDQCVVCVGSPVEVAASLYAYGSGTLSALDRAFCKDARQLPLVKRLATSADPEAVSEIASSLGIDISPRSARRIIDGEISEAEPILDRIVITGARADGPGQPARRKQAPVDARGLKLAARDAAALSDAVGAAFSDIAERYYLEPHVKPAVKARRDRIIISVPVVKRP